MVGIHALSIAKFVTLRSGLSDPKRARSANRLVARPKQTETAPHRSCMLDRGAFSMQRTTPRNRGVHAHKDLLLVSPLAVCLSALDARTRWQIPGWRSRPTAKVAPLYRQRFIASRILCTAFCMGALP